MHKQKTLQSVFLLAGAFIFAFLLGEMVHDFGHYLGHIAYGNSDIRGHLDPFGNTHIIGMFFFQLLAFN